MALPNDIKIPFPIEFIDIPQSNYRKGRSMNPDMIVIHIADGSKQSVTNHFKTPGIEVSAHFLVCKDGSITQYVGTSNTAYANGVLNNPVAGLVISRIPKNPNDYSISIEHEAMSPQDINQLQYATSSKLVKYLSDKWSIPLDRSHVVSHREITGTKLCPGVIDVEKIIRGAKYGIV